MRVVEHFADILEDDSIQLVASAAIPNQRAEIGVQVLEAGKDYFTDKSPFTTLEQLKPFDERLKQQIDGTSSITLSVFTTRLLGERAKSRGAAKLVR